jgi:hypothetical protein
METVDSWHHGVSLSSHQVRLDSLLTALKALANDGLTAGARAGGAQKGEEDPATGTPGTEE